MIYLDHAATTKISPTARDAMLSAMETAYGNPSSLHALGQQASAVLNRARESIARQLGASPREIYFTSGGSEGDNQALRTGAKNGAAEGKRHIVSTAMEHHAVLHTLEALEQEGLSVTYLQPDGEGSVSPGQLEEALRPDTAMVSIMEVNNETGTIQPIRELAAVCRRHGVLFHTDAVQAVGHIPVDGKADGGDCGHGGSAGGGDKTAGTAYGICRGAAESPSDRIAGDSPCIPQRKFGASCTGYCQREL